MEAGQAPQLRPLALGEILDVAFKIYGRRFKTLMLCVLVPTVPLAFIQILALLSISESLLDPALSFDPNAEDELAEDDLEGASLVALGITLLLGGVVTFASVAACIRAVAGAYLGDEVDWKASLGFGLKRMLPVLGLTFLIGVVCTAGLFLLLVPGVFLFIRLGVTIPARLIEDAKWFSSLGRSWTLVGGRWWVTFALYFLLVVLTMILSGLLQFLLLIPAVAVDSVAVAFVANFFSQVVSNAVVLPLAAAVITVHYFDLRVRREGFDLQLLARDVGGSSSVADVARSSGLGRYDPPTTHGGFSAPQPPGERGGA